MIGMDKLWIMYQKRFSKEYRVGRDTFRSILHERALNIVRKTRAPRTTDSRHNLPTYPNLVKTLIPTRSNHVWVSDITYLPIVDSTTKSGYRFCFLTLIMDAYSKRILGYCVAPTLEAQYSIKALKQALKTLPDDFSDTLIHHSDRGVQYASSKYIKQLIQANVTPSMTESGNPKDNAIAERVNNTIKNELLHKRIFVTFNEAVRAVDKAIAFYNTERPHSSLDWHTPEQAHHMCREIKKHWYSWRGNAIRREQTMAIR